MSFSSDAKAELCRVPLTRRCCARAEAYGVLLYAGSFSPTEVRIVTESEDFAARLQSSSRRRSAFASTRRRAAAKAFSASRTGRSSPSF